MSSNNEKKINDLQGTFLSRFSIAWELSKYSSRRKVNGVFLGAFWSFLEPLLLFIILIFLRNKLGNTSIAYYPVYLFVGLLSFQFFAQATRRIMICLNAYSRYAKTFPLPLDTYVFATYFETLKDFSWQLIILLALLLWSSLNSLFIIPFLAVFIVFSFFVLGLGFFLAASNVYFKDLEVIWGLICRILFFATPIFYSVDFAPSFIRLNPLVPYLEQFRGILIGNQFNLFLMLVLVLVSLLSFISGRAFFKALQKRIVEAI